MTEMGMAYWAVENIPSKSKERQSMTKMRKLFIASVVAIAFTRLGGSAMRNSLLAAGLLVAVIPVNASVHSYDPDPANLPVQYQRFAQAGADHCSFRKMPADLVQTTAASILKSLRDNDLPSLVQRYRQQNESFDPTFRRDLATTFVEKMRIALIPPLSSIPPNAQGFRVPKYQFQDVPRFLASGREDFALECFPELARLQNELNDKRVAILMDRRAEAAKREQEQLAEQAKRAETQRAEDARIAEQRLQQMRQQAEAEEKRAQERRAEEARLAELRLQQLQQKREAEEKRNQERRDEQAKIDTEQHRIADLPANKLLNAYRLYAHLQFCSDVRQGYLAQYISDAELERARTATKAIEKQSLEKQSDLDTDEVWHSAVKAIQGLEADHDRCHVSLNSLLAMSPVPVYNLQKP
jgi:hypothetical protein